LQSLCNDSNPIQANALINSSPPVNVFWTVASFSSRNDTQPAYYRIVLAKRVGIFDSQAALLGNDQQRCTLQEN
jgi:hypothetical protein